MLYPLLVAHADDFGRLAGDVFTVKHAVIPASPRSLDDVIEALTYLHQVGLVQWYDASGKQCLQIVDFDRHQAGLHKRTNSEFPGNSGKFPEIPKNDGKPKTPIKPAFPGNSGNFREIPSEGKGTELNRTEGEGSAEAPSPPPSSPSTSPSETPEASATSDDVDAIVRSWNERALAGKLPRCRALSDIRRRHVRARLAEHGRAGLEDAIERITASAFCTGENPRGWVATFDWLMQSPDHVLSALEGKYDNRPKPESVDARLPAWAR